MLIFETDMDTEKEKLHCPQCGTELKIDSVRKHTDGRIRHYWECDKCNLSIMKRDVNAKKSSF